MIKKIQKMQQQLRDLTADIEEIEKKVKANTKKLTHMPRTVWITTFLFVVWVAGVVWVASVLFTLIAA